MRPITITSAVQASIPISKLNIVLKLVFLLVIVKLMLIFYTAGFRTFYYDEPEHVQGAWLISQGYLPYRDYFEHHTPLFHFIVSWLFSIIHLLHIPIETNFQIAYTFILFLRLIMIFVLIAICAYSFCIGRIVGDSLKPPDGILVGSFSALFFIHSQFVVDVSADVRPDQLATLCVSAAIFSFINVSGDATARRRAFTGFFFCGILLATSILFTQKSLFVLPGIFLSSVFYLFVEKEKFFDRLSKLMMMVLGFILPIALMVGYFFSQNAFDNFIYYNFTINAKWPIEMPLWAVGGKLILRNPEFILGSLAGSAILIRQILLWHAATPLPIIVVAASLTSYLIGLLIIPIAQRQYYFQIIPLMAIVVSVGWVHGVRFIFRSGRAFMAASIGLLVFLSAVSVLQFGIRLYRHDVPRFNSIRVVLERTRPDDVVINGFRSQVLFRRSASYFAYLDGETCALMARDQHLQSLMGRLIDDVLMRRIQPAVITYEPQDCPMMEHIQDFLYQYYEPVERSFFWIRKQ